MEVTGEWKGYFCDPASWENRYPIRATLISHKGRLSGTMTDEKPSQTLPIAEILALRREHHPEADHTRWEECAQNFPELVWNVELPPNSELQGRFNPPAVSFVKRYLGRHSAAWNLGERTQTVTKLDNHRVHYEGTLSEDGNVIEGTWHIRHRGIIERWREPSRRGTFRLERH